MNNLISFWLAPVTAFFNPKVYRDAARGPVSRGVLYALYFAVIAAFLITIVVMVTVMPIADQFVGWVKKDIPVLIWTPEGLAMEPNIRQPHTMNHPVYGLIAIFDMSKSTVTEADMGKAYVFVTSKKVFLRRGPSQIETRDITQAGIQASQRNTQRMPSKIRITGEVLGQIYANAKRALFFLIPLFAVVIFFVFFLTSALFYSLIGLLLNLLRKNKLGYGAIFNLTCFAMTVSFIPGWLVRGLPAAWLFNVLVILGYMFFAFKVTDQEVAKV